MTGIAGLTRKAAVCAALLTGAIAVGAGPAHAASTDPPVDGTPVPAYSVDDDPIAIDTNFTVFSGTMKMFHDGSHVRATLSGTVRATQSDRCIGIEVKFTYADGTQDSAPRENTPNPCGTASASVSISSPSDRDVVKYSYYTRATGNGGAYFVAYSPTTEGLVGDAPASDGTCNLLDRDGVSSSGSGVPTFQGRTTYGCVTTSGNTTVALSGSLDKRNVPGGSTGSLIVTFTYADGTSNIVRTAGGTPKLTSDESGSYYVYPVSATSDSGKDVRSVNVRTVSQGSGLQAPTFAPQTSAGTSWFGTFTH